MVETKKKNITGLFLDLSFPFNWLHRYGQTILGITPSTGSTSGGQTVNILGLGFKDDSVVLLGTAKCALKEVSIDQLVCTTGSHQNGLVNLQVNNAFV